MMMAIIGMSVARAVCCISHIAIGLRTACTYQAAALSSFFLYPHQMAAGIELAAQAQSKSNSTLNFGGYLVCERQMVGKIAIPFKVL